MKRYFLVQLTITIRCYPRRFFEFTAKFLASASVHEQPGFILATVNSAAKPAPQPNATIWLGVTLTISLHRIAELFFPIQSVEATSVLPAPPLRIELRSLHFFFQLEPGKPGITRSANFELTREVFLPDPI